MHDIPERDWRVFRELQQVALERFCEKVLRDVRELALSPEKTWHERYGDVFQLLEREDQELARAFDAPRRSRAILQLAAMNARGLLRRSELDRFTVETREQVQALTPGAEPMAERNGAPGSVQPPR